MVLNRSDYDFHGYHGWDFFRVDPRLESSGATYQDLINAAHAKGIKIFQDVVYNHTSCWGAKGLFQAKVFGIRDTQWSWFYVQAALDQYNYENTQGTANQPKSANAFLFNNTYRTPDHSQFSGMGVIDMRMHMNFGDAANAFWNGKDSDDSYNDATYNVVYVDSHDFGPNKSTVAYNGGTAAWAENFSMMWTFRGIPNVLQGAEIEVTSGSLTANVTGQGRATCASTC